MYEEQIKFPAPIDEDKGKNYWVSQLGYTYTGLKSKNPMFFGYAHNEKVKRSQKGYTNDQPERF